MDFITTKTCGFAGTSKKQIAEYEKGKIPDRKPKEYKEFDMKAVASLFDITQCQPDPYGCFRTQEEALQWWYKN